MDVILTNADELRRIVSDAVLSASKELTHQPPDADVKEWLTNAEAMSFLGLSKSSLQRYRARGVLAYSKFGANIYYRRSDLVDLLERHQINDAGGAR